MPGLEERVRERTADLGRANEEIQRFAYIVSHDLRAPLVNIMGFTSELEGSLAAIAELIERSRRRGAERAVAQDARAAAPRGPARGDRLHPLLDPKMDGLINAILKLSREGRRVLMPEPIDLKALLKAAAANVQHQLDRGRRRVVDRRPSVPPLVADRLALEQIFGNLLDNAVKYLRRTAAADRRRARRRSAASASSSRSQDNGRGIAAQDHERVFELFRRSGAQDQPGEGIGLAHVRTMVRNLGGDITLQFRARAGHHLETDLPRDLRTMPRTGAA